MFESNVDGQHEILSKIFPKFKSKVKIIVQNRFSPDPKF